VARVGQAGFSIRFALRGETGDASGGGCGARGLRRPIAQVSSKQDEVAVVTERILYRLRGGRDRRQLGSAVAQVDAPIGVCRLGRVAEPSRRLAHLVAVFQGRQIAAAHAIERLRERDSRQFTRMLPGASA